MEIANHEYYVSLEVAKLLKEAGFDWECKTYYDISLYRDEIIIEGEFHDYNFTTGNIIFSAPTLEIAQRWLREKWDLIITIEYNYHENAFICKVYSKAECLSILFDFPVYEEAQEAGIKKALEIILEKGK